ncbi:MAG: sterol desaturase family protein [Myxococcota bacterium]
MSPESLTDYWSFFCLSAELGFRSVIVGLQAFLPTLVSGGYLGLSIIGFLTLCEWIRPWRPEQRRLRDEIGLDLFYTLANFLLFYQLVGNPVFQTVQLAFHRALHGLFGVELGVAVSLAGLHPWLQYLLLFLLVDLLSYLGHVLLHRSALLWTLHRVHHSARELDTLNALRQHWGEKLFYDFFTYVPLVLIGFGVEQTLFAVATRMLFCFFTHSNLKVPLGPLKYVFNNPQLHLWHHAREVPHNRNVNYGSALSMWDYLFRTAYLPNDRSDIELGFDGMEEFPTTLVRQQLHPFDRWLPKPTSRSRSLGRLGATGLTAVALGLLVVGDAIPSAVLAPTRVGYRGRAAEQLAAGRPGAALSTIERGALIDVGDVSALRNLLAESRKAGFGAPPVQELLRIGLTSANLRFRAGRAWLETVHGAGPLDAGRIDTLSDALANARFLVRLEPGKARSHYLLGATQLVHARSLEDSEGVDQAIISLSRSRALDASHPGLREALEEARALRDAERG